MKKAILKTLAGALMITGLFSTTLTSCSDPCKDVVCENEGTCDEGVCTCLDGFSGTNCEIEDLCVTQAITCDNGGTCLDGTCDCTAGYEGTNCETEMRTKFVGTYNGNATVVCGVSGNDAFTTNFAISTSSSDVSSVIIDIAGGGLVLTGVVDGTNITVNSQSANGYDYTGTGTISGSNVTMTLNEYDASVPETCVYTINGTKL